MTTFPRHPAQKAPAAIADHGRQVTRAHARLDEVESVQSKQTNDISTNAAATATNTSAIATANTNITTAQTGVNTNATNLSATDSRLGGSSHETYLGTLIQATAPGTPSHSGVGTVSGTVTAAEYNSLNTAYNNCADTVTALIGRLQASNILL